MVTRMSKDVETIPLILNVYLHYYRMVCAMSCLRHTFQTRGISKRVYPKDQGVRKRIDSQMI
jgi:hypothetical protein